MQGEAGDFDDDVRDSRRPGVEPGIGVGANVKADRLQTRQAEEDGVEQDRESETPDRDQHRPESVVQCGWVLDANDEDVPGHDEEVRQKYGVSFHRVLEDDVDQAKVWRERSGVEYQHLDDLHGRYATEAGQRHGCWNSVDHSPVAVKAVEVVPDGAETETSAQQCQHCCQDSDANLGGVVFEQSRKN